MRKGALCKKKRMSEDERGGRRNHLGLPPLHSGRCTLTTAKWDTSFRMTMLPLELTGFGCKKSDQNASEVEYESRDSDYFFQLLSICLTGFTWKITINVLSPMPLSHEPCFTVEPRPSLSAALPLLQFLAAICRNGAAEKNRFRRFVSCITAEEKELWAGAILI